MPIAIRSGIHTGYFGRYTFRGQPSATYSAIVVHVVDSGVPICGTLIHPDMEFQWCASGVYLPALECKRCRRSLRSRLYGAA